MCNNQLNFLVIRRNYLNEPKSLSQQTLLSKYLCLLFTIWRLPESNTQSRHLKCHWVNFCALKSHVAKNIGLSGLHFALKGYKYNMRLTFVSWLFFSNLYKQKKWILLSFFTQWIFFYLQQCIYIFTRVRRN